MILLPNCCCRRTVSCRGAFLILVLLCFPMTARAADGVQYSVSVQGVEDNALLEDLEKESAILKEQTTPLLSRFFLEKKAEQHLRRLLEICNAHGYYQAEAEVDLRQKAENVFAVIYRFDLGPLYRLATIRIEIKPRAQRADLRLPGPEELGIPEGSPALAEKILKARNRLQENVLAQGYFHAAQEDPEVRVSRSTQSVSVVFRLSPGSVVRFGPAEIQGQEKVDPVYIRNKIPWSTGERYDPKLIQEFRNELMAEGLFNLVEVQFADKPQENGLLPVTIRVKEKKQRSVRLGLGYETDIGPMGRAAWEHNNLSGRGERLAFGANVSGKEQKLTGTFQKPHFYRADQSLQLVSSLNREDYDSYQNNAFLAEGSLRRQLTPRTSLAGGIGYKLQTTEDAEGSNRFHLLFFPGRIEYDSRDDLLNPTRGMNIAFGLTPYQDITSSELTFFKSVLNTRWYRALRESEDLILALRTRLGSITGASSESIPADERFYAGGGGSVRGYPYQEISPQKDGDPFGGRSLLELSTEIRWKMSERFGLAFFLDGGQVTEQTLPDPGEKIFWGAGLGLRYFTDFGPLRFDIAFPLNKDKRMDESFQIYLSIGQAF